MKRLKTIVKDTIISLRPSWYNKRQCSNDGGWNEYFQEAESAMDNQWNDLIWPIIKDFDFDTVLELAPGAGRNTEKLAKISHIIHAVDLNEYVLEQLRERFKNYTDNCQLYFYRNNGSNLKMIKDGSISMIYCWDSAVHFDKSVMQQYIKEFSRVLKVGGKGFIHHSDLGSSANIDISKNPYFRSNMSKEIFRECCDRNNLDIINQTSIQWLDIQDCISTFQKNVSR